MLIVIHCYRDVQITYPFLTLHINNHKGGSLSELLHALLQEASQTVSNEKRGCFVHPCFIQYSGGYISDRACIFVNIQTTQLVEVLSSSSRGMAALKDINNDGILTL